MVVNVELVQKLSRPVQEPDRLFRTQELFDAKIAIVALLRAVNCLWKTEALSPVFVKLTYELAISCHNAHFSGLFT